MLDNAPDEYEECFTYVIHIYYELNMQNTAIQSIAEPSFYKENIMYHHSDQQANLQLLQDMDYKCCIFYGWAQ